MVLYFKCELVSPPYTLYMGAHKVENEELIRWGWPEDVWFHVDNLSSAHVYLRLRDGETLDDIPDSIIQDCAQLVKANSIQGCKQSDVDVVYTMWENLKKTNDMAVGQVSFHNSKAVRKTRVEKRVGDIVRRLEKTQSVVDKPDLCAEREVRDRRLREKEKEAQASRRKMEKESARLRAEEAERRSYDRLFVTSKMHSNADGNDSDDFM